MHLVMHACMRVFYVYVYEFMSVCVVRTEGRLRGLGSLHAGTVVGHVVVGTGAHGPAGAQQT